jgi:hypothetical protein
VPVGALYQGITLGPKKLIFYPPAVNFVKKVVCSSPTWLMAVSHALGKSIQALRTPVPASSPESRNPGLLAVVGDPYASISFRRLYSTRLHLLTRFLGFGSIFGQIDFFLNLHYPSYI